MSQNISVSEYVGMLIARHGEDVHKKMNSSCIGIAGLGGLGSNIAVNLARMGVKKIIGADFDVVDLSNVHRQQYFMRHIGMKKVHALKNIIEEISPLTDSVFIDIKVDSNNAKELFSKCDVLIEAFDLAESKAMLFNSWREDFSCFYVGASGVAGYDISRVHVKRLGSRAYFVGDFLSDSDDISLTAAKVGMIACMQASIAVSLLIDGVFNNGF